MTQYPKIFEGLAAEFAPFEVKVREENRGGRTLQMQYVQAASVKNRLDSVLGPENWTTSYIPVVDAVECRLTIRLPDGREVTKSGAGAGKDAKAAYSDALKRAAEEFGVGRYLRKLGVPRYQAGPAQPATVTPACDVNGHPEHRAPVSQSRPAPTDGAHQHDRQAGDHTRERPQGEDRQRPSGPPKTGRALFAWAREQSDLHQVDVPKWIGAWSKTEKEVDYPDRIVDFDAKQVAAAFAAACRKLESLAEAN